MRSQFHSVFSSVASLPSGVSGSTSADDMAGWSPQRRGFLRAVSAGAGMMALGPLVGCGSSNASPQSDSIKMSLMQDQQFWTDVQGAFTLNAEKTFMNIGTAGSMSKRVQDRFDLENRAYARESLNGYGSFATERTAAAPGFGVDPDELVFSGNTSDGMCHAVLGVDWKAGDVIITTNHEHPGGNVPMQIAADRYGVEIVRVLMPVGTSAYMPPGGGTGATHNAQTYINLFDAKISEVRAQGKRVRAMVWSSPTYKTGTLLPIRKLVQLAIARSTAADPIITIVDGAHLPGMKALNYASEGMDFMAGAGHKWQCGPGSTGILIVRNKVRATANPLPLPKYWPVVTSAYPPTTPAGAQWQVRATGPTATYDIASIISSCGSKHAPLFKSLAEACKQWDEIGRAKIQTYTDTLSKYLKTLIVDRWGSADVLYSPNDDELACALTSFNPFITRSRITSSATSTAFVNTLLTKYGFVVRNVNVPIGTIDPATQPTDHWPIRISTHLWHDAADVERLVDAMWTEAQLIG
jgi:isopenicillin-N epimerase